ncbi:unnamed protein product [Mytilus coruscus]|uniref:CCHC-type domain-containing protein n=1 Tax=Mytilus coruscus TaxID=42192 RepID=A0A6J8BQN3_MYTCO|nr:unnamed protein product [Mytilus coruscus]
MSKSDKGDCNLPRSQSVRINDEFSSDEDTEIYDPRLRSYDRASSLERPSNISLNSKFKVKLPIFSGIESWKVWLSRFTEGNKLESAPGSEDKRVQEIVKLVLQNLNSQKEDKETFDKEYKQLGHNAKGSNSDIRTCFCSGKEGHIARSCWKKGNTQNQEKRNDRQSFNSGLRNNKKLN